MNKSLFFYLVCLFVLQMGLAQNNLVWKGYFSYNSIKDLSQSANTIFAASENALFSKNNSTNEILTRNTIDGLSGQSIATIYFSSVSNKSLVGYESGLLIVIDAVSGKMFPIVDIVNKQIPANLKKINHFTEYEGIIYVSCDFGIVQFNLATLLFGDTYFIGNNGSELGVNQTAVSNGFIFAATSDGIRRADINNKNLNDFNQWSQIASGNWFGIEIVGNDIVAVNSAANLHKYVAVSNSFIGFYQLPQATEDMRATNDYLICATPNHVFVFNTQLVLIKQVNTSQVSDQQLSFTCATSIEDILYLGTKENGIYNTSITSSTGFENILPSGPSRNSIFALKTTATSFWSVYGDYNLFYNPYSLDNYGISKFTEKGWLHIPYEKVLGAKSMVRITINPSNENEVYASSFFSGLLKIENDTPTILYNEKNSGLEELVDPGDPNYRGDVRINGAAFDTSGTLWLTNSQVKNGLKSLNKSGQWQSYNIDKILSSSEKTSFGRLSIDQNGTKWIATDKNGLIGFNEKNNLFKKITFGSETGNLPSSDVRVATPDNNNQLWIGTTGGLRILSNVNNFTSDEQLTTKPIIILEDGLAQELLFEQYITDIVVDGANNKWIATIGSGVFLLSPDGQETKYHFTEKNSPLPSNVINDIEINNTTGEVFIATQKGMVSFKGTGTAAGEDLSKVYVYPNPVRPDFKGTVKVAGLLNKATIKITDIEGNLVHETTSEGGTIEWDTTAFGKHKVASGVYMIFISSQDGIETKVKKVMIIR